jgi:hypothetical protein
MENQEHKYSRMKNIGHLARGISGYQELKLPVASRGIRFLKSESGCWFLVARCLFKKTAKDRGEKNALPTLSPNMRAPVRKWYPDHKRFFAISNLFIRR